MLFLLERQVRSPFCSMLESNHGSIDNIDNDDINDEQSIWLKNRPIMEGSNDRYLGSWNRW